MDKVHVIGRIFPSAARFSIRSPALSLTSSTTGLQVGFRVAVQDSTVNVECYLEKYGPEHFTDILNGAYDYARTLTNLIGFANGMGISIVFDYAILPDGELTPVVPQSPELPALCTAYGLEEDRRADLQSVIRMVILDRNLYRSFNDLIDTQIIPHISIINSARVIDTIRRLIAPALDRTPAWAEMHKALNVSEAYLRWVTDQSRGPRHGDPSSQASASTQMEATRRAWVTMNRYLEYRKRGGQPLTDPEFPELV